MNYINTAYLFKCQTCRHFRSDECNTFCENGECYSPNMRMIPTADVVEVKHGKYVYSSTDDKWHCSECFAERPRNNGEIPYSDIYCCYKCGAIMDGGKAE